jgi:N utilization substance protein B
MGDFMSAGKPIPASLRRKSSARLAAVQCLYRLRLMGEEMSAETLLEEYLAQWKDDKDTGAHVISRDAEPDKAFLRKLLSGLLEKREDIDVLIRAALSDKWTMERMSPLLLSLLACAIYEMRFAGPLAPAIVINEYVTLTGRFFETPEMGFVNGLLDSLAKEGPGA